MHKNKKRKAYNNVSNLTYAKNKYLFLIKQYITKVFLTKRIERFYDMYKISIYQIDVRLGVLLYFINPVQFPLHEPYFDLTPIKVMHTKIVIPKYLLINKQKLIATKLIAHTFFSA